MATYNLGNEGLSPGDRLDSYIDSYIDGAVGDTIRIPAGTYPVRNGHEDMPLDGVTVEGIGGQVVWDLGHNHTHQIGWHAQSDSTIRDIVFSGQAGGGNPMPVWANSGAEIRFENCGWPDGSANTNGNGIYLRAQGGNRSHWGVARFVNSEISGFGDNGIYGQAEGVDGGVLYVEGCEFYNNNISSVRFGGNGSYVRDTYFEVTDSQTPSTGSGQNARGVWIHSGGSYTVENCDFVFDSDYNPINTRHSSASGSTTEVRNCRFVQHGSGSLINEGQGNITGGGNHGTGAGTDAEHVFACLNSGCEQPGDSPDDEPEISDTYKGVSKDLYFYCGTETDAYWQWRNREISTERFAYLTDQGQGTAQLQTDPCESDDPDPGNGDPDDGNGGDPDDGNGGETPDDGSQAAGVGVVGLGIAAAAIAREWKRRRS